MEDIHTLCRCWGYACWRSLLCSLFSLLFSFLFISLLSLLSSLFSLLSSLFSLLFFSLIFHLVGIGTVIRLIPSLQKSLSASLVTLTQQISSSTDWRNTWERMIDPVRTSRDTPFLIVIVGVLIMPIPLYLLFIWIIPNHLWSIALFATLSSLFCGFMFSSVGAYMAGLFLLPSLHSLFIFSTSISTNPQIHMYIHISFISPYPFLNNKGG